MEIPIKIEVFARHIHLSSEDAQALFGKPQLVPWKYLSQPGHYACEETVDVSTSEGNIISKVRVVGPATKITFVELSPTNLHNLKIQAPLLLQSEPGEPIGTTVKIVGSQGEITSQAAVTKQRHIHCSLEDATKNGWQTSSRLSIDIPGEKGLTFHNVVVQIEERCTFQFCINTDEANAAGVKGGEIANIVRVK